MDARRELRSALLLVLVGAALVLLGARQHWVDVVLPQSPPLPPRGVTRSGGDVVAALSPLGLLGLAGVAALAATRALGRVLVGALLTLAGAGVCVGTVQALAAGALAALDASQLSGREVLDRAPAFTGWPWVALVGGVLLAGGGLVVAVRGRRWATLSARYEAPAARAERPPARPEVAAWDALDRGEDPTLPAGPSPGPPPDRPGT